MFGFISTAKSSDIVLLDNELEDAKWFSRNEIAQALNGSNPNLTLPPTYAIAHTLISAWLDSTTSKI